MAGLFEVPKRTSRKDDSSIAKKSNSKVRNTPTAVKSGGGMFDRINTIRAMVEKNLGQYREETLIIQDIMTLTSYIDKCIDQKLISIDTETTGLDPMLDDIAGVCIYTPGQKTAYIPINHVSYVTGIKVDNQIPIELIREQFQRITDIDIIMFNACFDMRFMKNQVGVKLSCTWDCYLAARLLNENEGAGNNNLKKLHQKYVLNGEGDAFRFDDLFKGIPFTYIPISVGSLYAAHDPKITYELYEFQRPFLTAGHPDCIERGLEGVAWVFHNIEMPCVQVIADMEDEGIEFDFVYNEKLHEKYHSELDLAKNRVYDIIAMYSNEVELYKASNPANKLSDPINIDSPTQIAILLYDIMKVKPVIDKKTKQLSRGTGEDILQQLDTPLSEALLTYRGIGKLINTYIDKLPDCVNPNDGRIHCKFNQYGADTGRMSSSDPNLQNIPSHNKDIRKMFKASSGEELIPEVDNHFEVDRWSEVKSQRGWISACNVVVGDRLEVDDTTMIIVNKIEPVDNNHILLYY